MKRLMLAALAAGAVLLVALPSLVGAATVGVSIERNGFSPRNVTVQVGDTVTWTNNDTANHQVASQAAGFTSPVLAPRATYSHTFTRAGRFEVVDPLNRNRRMTVTVNAAPAPSGLTLRANRTTVVYGGAITLSGALAPARTGERIDVLAQMCGANSSRTVTTTTTTAGGAFSVAIRPTKNTIYTVRSRNVTSGGVTIRVRPRIVLSKIRARQFRVRAYAADSLVGRSVVFRRYLAAQRKWRSVKRVVLRTRTTAVTPLPGTTVSSVSFGVRLRAGFRVRAVMPAASAAPCYIAGSSPVIRS